jgi:UTP--glucose-1-phosphate uridylyltransferase
VQSIAKGVPKELLPLHSKPLIQHALEMHIWSGVEEIVIIIHPEKEILRDFLEGKSLPTCCGVDRASDNFLDLLKGVELHFLYQHERSGVVDAVLLAKRFIADEWFSIIMPDCLLIAEKPFLSQLLQVPTPGAYGVIGFIMLEKMRSNQFGNVGLLTVIHKQGVLYRISHLSNKETGTVQFAGGVHAKGLGGGVYTPAYFDYVAHSIKKGGLELDDVPIHQAMAADKKLYGVKLQGVAFDVGNEHGYLAAQKFIWGSGTGTV